MAVSEKDIEDIISQKKDNSAKKTAKRKVKTAFSKANAKEKADKSHSEKSEKKRAETRKANQEKKLVEAAVMQSMRSVLTEVDPETNLAWYEKFLRNFTQDAANNPTGRPAQLLASNFFSADVLSKLDAETDRIIAKDVAFSRYRLYATLFDKQKQVIDDRFSKQKCIICGRRSGKTEMNARLLVDASLEPNTPSCYIHLTFSNGIAQVYDNVIKAAEAISLPIKHESKTEGEIEFTNGSVIRFRGNANKAESEKVRGFKYKLVIIDECQSQRSLKYLVEDIIQPLQLDFAEHQLVLTGTPPRVPHTYFESAYTGHEYKSYHWDMRDNPFIPNVFSALEEICRQKGLTMDSPLIQREYLGLIVYDTDALVYRDYKTYDGNLPLGWIPDRVYIGVDFGFSDNNAVITLAANTQQKKAYVIRESKFNKATVTEIVDDVNKAMEGAKELIFQRNKNIDISSAISVICDTNEKSIAYELSQTYRLPVYCAYKYDKMMAIAQMSQSMRTGQIQIPGGGPIADECERTVYRRDEETDAILNEIDDEVFHPDAMDALLYSYRMFSYDIGADLGGKGECL